MACAYAQEVPDLIGGAAIEQRRAADLLHGDRGSRIDD